MNPLTAMFTASRATDTPDISFTAPVEIEARAGTDRPITATIELYDGHVMRIAGMGNVVVDLSQMTIPEQVPLLADHRNEVSAVIGYGTPTTDGRTLRVVGTILKSSKVAQEIVAMAREGMRFEASQGTHPEGLKRIKAGNEITINGRTITAPEGGLLVAAPSILKEATITPIGAGSNTATTIHSKKQGGVMPFWKQNKGGTTDPQNDHDDRTPEHDIEAAWIADIAKLCGDDHPSIRAKALADGWSIERVEAAVSAAELDAMRRGRGTDGRSALMGGNGRPDAGQVIAAALQLNGGLSEQVVAEGVDERVMSEATSSRLRGLGIQGVFHAVLEAANKPIGPGRFGQSTIRAAFEASRELQAAGFSTMGLSGILGDSANKFLLDGFRSRAATWHQIARQRNNRDFKTHTRYRLTPTGQYEVVAPDGNLRHLSIDTEQSFASQLETRGAMVTLSRQTIIDDDLDAFADLPRGLGRLGLIALERALYTLILSNPSSFFDASNGNYFDGASTNLSVDSLTTAEQKFMDMTDPANGNPVLAVPSRLLVPSSLKTTGRQVLNSTEVARDQSADNQPTGNPHSEAFTLVATPWLNSQSLTGSSDTAWYLLADPAELAAVAVAFLNGVAQPTIESNDADFNTLGMSWRAFHDFDVAMEDPRGAVKSKGAA